MFVWREEVEENKGEGKSRKIRDMMVNLNKRWEI
jgi:hypothetical protein